MTAYTEPESDAECRKQITAHLRAGGTFAIIDNVGRPLRWDSLAALLTTNVWADRILGHSRITKLPNSSLWLATGNGIELAGDLPRRSVLIRLESSRSRAWRRRDFRHHDLLGWVRSRLPQLQGACATLCAAWGAAGMPSARHPALGSFERWADVVAGVLAWAGIDGFLGNLDSLHLQSDVAARDFENFVRAVGDIFGDGTFMVRDVLQHVRSGRIDAELIPEEMGSMTGHGASRRVGRALRRWARRRLADDGLRVEITGRESRGGRCLYQVLRDTMVTSLAAVP